MHPHPALPPSRGKEIRNSPSREQGKYCRLLLKGKEVKNSLQSKRKWKLSFRVEVKNEHLK